MIQNSKGPQPAATLFASVSDEEDSEPGYVNSSSDASDSPSASLGGGSPTHGGARLHSEMGSGDGENMSLGQGPPGPSRAVPRPSPPQRSPDGSEEGGSEDMGGMSFCRNCTQVREWRGPTIST